MKRLPEIVASLALIYAALLAGCGSNVPALSSIKALTQDQFTAYYDDGNAFTDVYYLGTDPSYHYFCLEHWTFQPDGSSGVMDRRVFYKVAVTEVGVKRPFPLTYNQDQWRLMRPHGEVKSAPD